VKGEVEQQSSRAAENPPYLPFTKWDELNNAANRKSLFLKEG